MNVRPWLCCWVCVSCAGAQYERPGPGEFAGPPAVRAPDRTPDASAPWLEPQPTPTQSSDGLAVPTPAPNTSIEPSESQAVCAAAIAQSRAASPRPVAQPGATAAGLTPDQIRRTTLRNLRQITECQERVLAAGGEATARIVVRFVIGPDGSVIAAAVTETSTDNRFLRQCMVNAIRGWRFDAPLGGGDVTVNYPFNLSPPEN
jgi:TonB family protein